MNYNYFESMKSDVMDYINNEIDLTEWKSCNALSGIWFLYSKFYLKLPFFIEIWSLFSVLSFCDFCHQ